MIYVSICILVSRVLVLVHGNKEYYLILSLLLARVFYMSGSAGFVGDMVGRVFLSVKGLVVFFVLLFRFCFLFTLCDVVLLGSLCLASS